MARKANRASGAKPQIEKPEPVGLIGIGLMGTAFAERLLAGGFAVVGYDVEPSRRAALRDLGGKAVPQAASVAKHCRRIILSLPDSDVVREIVGEMSKQLGAGHIILDTTTGDPQTAVEIGRALGRRGAAYLDATVSGNSTQARRRDAVVMAGGPLQAFEQCRDVLECFARAAFHLGSWGSGSRMKLVTNVVLGLNRAALAEGLSFAAALGFDLEQTLAVLRESAAYSRVMDIKGGRMIRGDFAPEARLSQHLKDVRLILDTGAEAGARLPLSRTHKDLLERAEAAGLGALDNSAIIRVFQKRAAGKRPESR